MVSCHYCTQGFRRVDGIHIGSQRLGMIPDAPCKRVFTEVADPSASVYDRRWVAHVDGDLLRRRDGEIRRFRSAGAAIRAARKAAPRSWHP